ncbi:MAG TPA: LysM domain-containing protein [Solirubrobacterales bacterium]|jgi:LysM repeat protein
MKKRSSAPARIAAATTLVVAFVIAVIAIAGALGGGGSNGSGTKHGTAAHHASQPKRNVPATYEVKSGDTLISIAHRNGVTVARIEALNPEVDPQILIAGEKLKLK